MRVIVTLLTATSITVAVAQTTTSPAVLLSRNIVAKAGNVELAYDDKDPVTKAFAIDNALDIIRLAQHTVELNGKDILSNIELRRPAFFRVTGLKMVRLSNLSTSEKTDLLKRIIRSANQHDDHYCQAEAAILLAGLNRDAITEMDLGTAINASLLALKREGVELIRYWILLQALQQLSITDKITFNQLIASFAEEVQSDLLKVNTRGQDYLADSKLYGIIVFPVDSIELPEILLDRWCGEWLCPDDGTDADNNMHVK